MECFEWDWVSSNPGFVTLYLWPQLPYASNKSIASLFDYEDSVRQDWPGAPRLMAVQMSHCSGPQSWSTPDPSHQQILVDLTLKISPESITSSCIPLFPSPSLTSTPSFIYRDPCDYTHWVHLNDQGKLPFEWQLTCHQGSPLPCVPNVFTRLPLWRVCTLWVK